jgi:hypothetical protein
VRGNAALEGGGALRGPKGNLKFPPAALALRIIARIVRFQVKQGRARAAEKKKRR